jgi:hypothetical protein
VALISGVELSTWLTSDGVGVGVGVGRDWVSPSEGVGVGVEVGTGVVWDGVDTGVGVSCGVENSSLVEMPIVVEAELSERIEEVVTPSVVEDVGTSSVVEIVGVSIIVEDVGVSSIVEDVGASGVVTGVSTSDVDDVEMMTTELVSVVVATELVAENRLEEEEEDSKVELTTIEESLDEGWNVETKGGVDVVIGLGVVKELDGVMVLDVVVSISEVVISTGGVEVLFSERVDLVS